MLCIIILLIIVYIDAVYSEQTLYRIRSCSTVWREIFADGSSNDNLRIKFSRMPSTEESRDRTQQPSEVHWKYALDDDGSKRTDLHSFTPK